MDKKQHIEKCSLDSTEILVNSAPIFELPTFTVSPSAYAKLSTEYVESDGSFRFGGALIEVVPGQPEDFLEWNDPNELRSYVKAMNGN